MAVQAPNASYHHTALGIKGASLAKAKLASPLVGIRQTGFEDGNEITTETDEGHTGVSNIDMGSYRTKAESAPNWEDGLRFGQGYEDYFYLLLGTDTINAYKPTGSDTAVDGVYQHMMTMPPNVAQELPFATIYHGFSKTETDGRIFNNAMLNELEVTFSSDNKPSIKPTFVSDYNYVNMINPPRDFVDNHLARTVMAQHTKVFIGNVGDAFNELTSIDCFTEASFTVNNNAESQACHDDKFGENTKLMGARECTGSITMPFTATIDGTNNVLTGTRYFETEYEAYEKFGHIVSELITQKQIVYYTQGGMIQREVTEDEVTTLEDTGVKYLSAFTFPVVEVTNVTSTKSGTDAKEITFEWKCIEQPDSSYMRARFLTDLQTCHIDNSGQNRADFYPTASNTTLSAATYGNTFEPYATQ